MKERRALARTSLVPHIAGVSKLDLGLKLTFADTDALRASVENFISLERQCCGFLSFKLTPPGDGLVLTIDGPPEARATIDMFAAGLTKR